MKVDKKERTLRGCRELAENYRNPVGKTFFNIHACPLCKIHYKMFMPNKMLKSSPCRGCPLANKYGNSGCIKFKSGELARDTLMRASPSIYLNDLPIEIETANKIKEAFEARAKFFDKIIPILKKIPASRFTRKGWRYFYKLNRSW